MVLSVFFLQAGVICANAAPESAWDGEGNNNLWSTAANWVGDVVPSNPAVDMDTTFATQSDSKLAVIKFGGLMQTDSKVDDSGWYIDTLRYYPNAASFSLTGGRLTFRPSNSDITDRRFFVMNQSGTTETINNNILLLAAASDEIGKSGAGIFAGDGSTTIFNGNIEFRDMGGVRVSGQTGTVVFNGVISESGQAGDFFIAINAGATAAFNNVENTFTRSVVVWNGTLMIGGDVASGKAGSLGVGTSEVGLGNGVEKAPYTARLLATNDVTVARGVNLNFNNDLANYVIGGTGSHTVTFASPIYNSNPGSGASKLTVTADAGGRVNILSIERRAGGGSNARTDTVAKIGDGVVAFTGTSTYAGRTDVNAGVLLVSGLLVADSKDADGNKVATEGVFVSSGATLGGGGTIDRPVSIGTQGVLSPGDVIKDKSSAIGKLAMGKGLVLDKTSVCNFDLAGANSGDRVFVKGDLVLEGVLNIVAHPGFSAGDYELFNYTGHLSGGGLTLGKIPAGYRCTIETGKSGWVILKAQSLR